MFELAHFRGERRALSLEFVQIDFLGGTVVTETVKVTRKTYSQDWKAYNHAQTHEKSELQSLTIQALQKPA